ncbi:MULTISPECIES: hypothetical protein [unclassified Streptomyces]
MASADAVLRQEPEGRGCDDGAVAEDGPEQTGRSDLGPALTAGMPKLR